MGRIFAELVLFLLGGFMAACPKVMVRFQIWIQRTLMGAQYIPSQRTYIAIRLLGVFLIVLGLVVAVGVLRQLP
jgi:hypothetical protein